MSGFVDAHLYDIKGTGWTDENLTTIDANVDLILAAVGGPALQLRVEQSITAAVEEDAIIAFAISIFDVDSGAVASGSIDITGITAVLEKSTGGAAFSNAGITQPTFAKANGLVSVNYRFLAAEWEIGDVYKLAVSGITCTIGGDTAYIKDIIWSNIITELQNVEGKIDAIQTDIGDPSARTNLQSLEGMLGNPDTAGKTVYEAVKNVRETAIAGGSVPVTNTLSDTLHKDGSYTYDNTTDSLEAISDELAEVPKETGTKTFNGTALASIEAEATDAIEADDLDHLLMLDGATQKYPENCATDSIVAKILVKADPAVPSQYDNSTDSLEAIRDVIDTYNTADQIDLDAIIVGTITNAAGADVATDIVAVKAVVDAIVVDITSAVDTPPTTNSLQDTLHKDGSYTYDNTTDSLEAIRDRVDTLNTADQVDLDAIIVGVITNATGVDVATDVVAIQTDLDNATDGLGALKILIDANQTDLNSVITGVITNATGVDVATDVVAVKAETVLILEDTGTTIPNQITALNNISTAQVNTEVDTALNTIVPATPTAGSVNDILSKAGGGNTFDKTTDSLEALRDQMDTLNTADQVDLDAILLDTGTTIPGTITTVSGNVDTNQDLLDGTTATPTAYRREYGVTQVIEISVTAAANATVTTIATVTTQPCLIKSIVLHSDGVTTTDLTSAAIKGGAAQVVEFISAATAAKANIDVANEQVSWTGAVRLPAATTIAIDLQGTGATAVDFTVTIEYMACVDGGYLVV